MLLGRGKFIALELRSGEITENGGGCLGVIENKLIVLGAGTEGGECEIKVGVDCCGSGCFGSGRLFTGSDIVAEAGKSPFEAYALCEAAFAWAADFCSAGSSTALGAVVA